QIDIGPRNRNRVPVFLWLPHTSGLSILQGRVSRDEVVLCEAPLEVGEGDLSDSPGEFRNDAVCETDRNRFFRFGELLGVFGLCGHAAPTSLFLISTRNCLSPALTISRICCPGVSSGLVTDSALSRKIGAHTP